MDRLTEDHFSFKCPMRWEDMAVSLSAAACENRDMTRTLGEIAPPPPSHDAALKVMPGKIKRIPPEQEVIVPGVIAPFEPEKNPEGE